MTKSEGMARLSIRLSPKADLLEEMRKTPKKNFFLLAVSCFSLRYILRAYLLISFVVVIRRMMIRSM